MFDTNTAIAVFLAKCARVIADSRQAFTSSDVEDAYATWCEVEGMAELLAKANGVAYIGDAYPSVLRKYNEAWIEWNAANTRVNYDPVTGNRWAVL